MAPVSHFGKRFRRLCLQTRKVNFSFGLIEGRFSRHVSTGTRGTATGRENSEPGVLAWGPALRGQEVGSSPV